MEEDAQEEGGSKQEIFITEEDDGDYEEKLVISDEKCTDSPSSSADEDAVNISPSDVQKFVKSDEETAVFTVTRKQNENEPSGNVAISFSWPEYLKETGSVAAPDDCFYQDPIPPKNKFTVGKKVEVPDPRGKEVQCLATIVAVHSLWICVRLDGEDGSNDHWLICDDECIKPVGECERNGLTLQPPFGYMYNLSTYHKFIENQLKPESDGSIPAASLESFTPISFKYYPRRNKFQVGMKCEAIDRKNFNGRPCPATVIDIKGDYLMISYDGWNKAYDTRERFDSRYIFPAGWAARCGLEVQPPNRVKGKVIQRPIQKEILPKVRRAVAPKMKIMKRKSSVTNASSQPPRSRKPKLSLDSGSCRSSSSDSRSSRLLDVIDQVAKQNKMGTNSVSSPSSGRHISNSLDGGEDKNVPRARKTVPSSNHLEILQNKKFRKPITSPNTLENSLAIADIVLSTMDMQPENQKLTVYLNRSCRCSPMLNVAHVNKLPEKIGPGCLHHILRETVQQIVNCAADPSLVFKKVDPGTPRILCVTAEINGLTHVRAIPAVKTLASAWSYLHDFIAKLDVCRNFLTQEPESCRLCCPSEDGVVSTTAGGGTLKCGGESDDPEDYEGHQYFDLADWTMERVATEVEKMFDANIADKFLQNQIDGKALMLLTTELLIRHLEMPFGPALKMMSFIKSLKNKVRRADSRIVK